MGVTEEGTSLSDESKKKAGLLDKKVKAFFVLRNCAEIIWWLWTTTLSPRGCVPMMPGRYAIKTK